MSIYYDNLSTFVSCRNHAIMSLLSLPPLHQGHDSSVAMSSMLGGGFVPFSQEVVNGLTIDQSYGVASLRLVLMGRLRWKVGAFRSGHYGLYVKCGMLVGLKKGFAKQVPLLGSSNCNVDL